MASTLKDLLKQASLDAEKRLKIFNPDSESFTCEYDGKKYSIGAEEFKTFPLSIADHITKHLSFKILYKRHVKPNVRVELQKIRKEIRV